MPKMTPSEAMAEVLVEEGVKHVSGILGSAYMDLLDLFPAAGIDFISVRHEQTAGHMEDAFCRMTGKAGVVIAERPRHHQLRDRRATANMAHSPMIILSPSAGSASVAGTLPGMRHVESVQAHHQGFPARAPSQTRR